MLRRYHNRFIGARRFSSVSWQPWNRAKKAGVGKRRAIYDESTNVESSERREILNGRERMSNGVGEGKGRSTGSRKFGKREFEREGEKRGLVICYQMRKNSRYLVFFFHFVFCKRCNYLKDNKEMLMKKCFHVRTFRLIRFLRVSHFDEMISIYRNTWCHLKLVVSYFWFLCIRASFLYLAIALHINSSYKLFLSVYRDVISSQTIKRKRVISIFLRIQRGRSTYIDIERHTSVYEQTGNTSVSRRYFREH